jgi:cation diffusion facilitator CzcD-associated flavoprotein CzcO
MCNKNKVSSFGCSVIAFEQSDKIGGTWEYIEETGDDIHTSMYSCLQTDIPDDGDSNIPSRNVLEFLNKYATTFDLHPKIKFRHQVTWGAAALRRKRQRNLSYETFKTFFFDAFLVCNRIFHKPSLSDVEGRETFAGKQIHSHAYRTAEPLKDENVLIVGAGFCLHLRNKLTIKKRFFKAFPGLIS